MNKKKLFFTFFIISAIFIAFLNTKKVINVKASDYDNVIELKTDGEIENDFTNVISLNVGDELPSVTTPLRSGYTFIGYYDKPYGDGVKWYDESGNPLIERLTYDYQNTSTLYACYGIYYNDIYFDKVLSPYKFSLLSSKYLPSGNYYLDADLTIGTEYYKQLRLSEGSVVNLLLNDHVLTSTNSSCGIFYLENGGTINVYDNGETTRYFEYKEGAHHLTLKDDQTFDSNTDNPYYISGGYITGKYLIELINSNITLNGINIIGAENSESGNILFNSYCNSNMIFNDCLIMGNEANLMFTINSSAMEFNSTVISYNYGSSIFEASNYLYEGNDNGEIEKIGVLKINSSEVRENTAKSGPVIDIKNGRCIISNTIITNNYSSHTITTSNKGTIYLDNGSELTLGGFDKICENFSGHDEKERNLVIKDGKLFFLNGDYILDDESVIQISILDEDENDTSKEIIGYELLKNYSLNFYPDNNEYIVNALENDNNEYNLIIEKVVISEPTNDNPCFLLNDHNKDDAIYRWYRLEYDEVGEIYYGLDNIVDDENTNTFTSENKLAGSFICVATINDIDYISDIITYEYKIITEPTTSNPTVKVNIDENTSVLYNWYKYETIKGTKTVLSIEDFYVSSGTIFNGKINMEKNGAIVGEFYKGDKLYLTYDKSKYQLDDYEYITINILDRMNNVSLVKTIDAKRENVEIEFDYDSEYVILFSFSCTDEYYDSNNDKEIDSVYFKECYILESDSLEKTVIVESESNTLTGDYPYGIYGCEIIIIDINGDEIILYSETVDFGELKILKQPTYLDPEFKVDDTNAIYQWYQIISSGGDLPIPELLIESIDEIGDTDELENYEYIILETENYSILSDVDSRIGKYVCRAIIGDYYLDSDVLSLDYGIIKEPTIENRSVIIKAMEDATISYQWIMIDSYNEYNILENETTDTLTGNYPYGMYFVVVTINGEKYVSEVIDLGYPDIIDPSKDNDYEFIIDNESEYEIKYEWHLEKENIVTCPITNLNVENVDGIKSSYNADDKTWIYKGIDMSDDDETSGTIFKVYLKENETISVKVNSTNESTMCLMLMNASNFNEKIKLFNTETNYMEFEYTVSEDSYYYVFAASFTPDENDNNIYYDITLNATITSYDYEEIVYESETNSKFSKIDSTIGYLYCIAYIGDYFEYSYTISLYERVIEEASFENDYTVKVLTEKEAEYEWLKYEEGYTLVDNNSQYIDYLDYYEYFDENTNTWNIDKPLYYGTLEEVAYYDYYLMTIYTYHYTKLKFELNNLNNATNVALFLYPSDEYYYDDFEEIVEEYTVINGKLTIEIDLSKYLDYSSLSEIYVDISIVPYYYDETEENNVYLDLSTIIYVNETVYEKIENANTNKLVSNESGTYICHITTENGEFYSNPVYYCFHDYVITYLWSEDNKECTAIAVCNNDDSHYIEEKVTTESTIIQNQACETPELTSYKAIFVNELFEPQFKENIQTKEALEHECLEYYCVKEATSTETGIMQGTCIHCDKVIEIEIPMCSVNVEEFLKSVNKSTMLWGDELFSQIKESVDLYSKLTIEERKEVQGEYETLLGLVNDYNGYVESLNEEFINENSNLVLAISSILSLLGIAVFIVSKKIL